jgi:hypothetical protein
MSETPLVYRDGRWFLSCPPRTTLICGSYFDPEHGYQVVLGFMGAAHVNYMSPNYARAIAKQLADDESDIDLLRLAISMERIADEMEFQNIAWESSGRPSSGIDETAGHA